MNKQINFILEAGVLSSIPRSGQTYLGSGKQSIAEHSFRTTCIAHLLSSHYKKVDTAKLIMMCLYHDFHESRTGDINPLQKKYCHADEKTARQDCFAGLPFAEEIQSILIERDECKTLESKLARDADLLEWLAFLTEQKWHGSKKAPYWICLSLPKLKTPAGKKLGKALVTSNPDNWWKKSL